MVVPIVTFQCEVLEDPDPAGFRFEAWRVPPGLPDNHVVRDRFDDRSIDVPREAGSVWFEVWVENRSRLAATATFAAGHETAQCDSIHVSDAYRRKGIATALYQLASSSFAAPVVPAASQTGDAKAFWGGRTEINAPEAAGDG